LATFASLKNQPHILLVCHTFPPYKGIGGRRWAKFAKELARRGFRVEVICAEGGTELLGSSWSGDTDHKHITVHKLPFKYPKIILKRKHQDIYEKLAYHFWIRVLPFLTKGNFFDKSVFWEKQFTQKFKEIFSKNKITHVIATGAPFRLLSYTADLKNELDFFLVSDLRDAWTNTVDYGLDVVRDKRKKYEADMEEKVMLTSDKVIFPHPMVIDHILKRDDMNQKKFIRLRHAIDPDDIGVKSTEPTSPTFKTMYAGSMYGGQEAQSYFEEVIKAYKEIKQRKLRARLDLYITEHNTIPYEDIVREERLDGFIFFHDPIPAKEVFRRMHHAHLVQLFIPRANRDLMGTKFTEIFHLRKPLLHVGPAGYVSQYITEHNLGLSLRVDQLSTQLPDIVAGKTQITINQSFDLSEHSLSNITDQLVDSVLEIPRSS